MNESMKYTFVCDPNSCDTLIEVTCASGFDFPNGVVELTCPCGRKMSYISATIQPTSERNKMETTIDPVLAQQYLNELELKYGNEITELKNRQNSLEQAKDRYFNMFNEAQSKINKIIDNLTEEYWYSEDMAEPILTELCEILDYEPKKEIEFTATIKFTGRIDVPMNEVLDFDLTAALEDAYVDINNGDIVIDGYELYDAEEC